jgi:uncharacterized protein YcgI (DUF1989 family)
MVLDMSIINCRGCQCCSFMTYAQMQDHERLFELFALLFVISHYALPLFWDVD